MGYKFITGYLYHYPTFVWLLNVRILSLYLSLFLSLSLSHSQSIINQNVTYLEQITF